MSEYRIELSKSNKNKLRNALKQEGYNLTEFSQDEVSNMLSYALGLVDYYDSKIIQTIIENK